MSYIRTSGRTRTFHPCNVKVADLQENDTLKHTLTLATMGLPLNTVAIIIQNERMGGTGSINYYPNHGAQGDTVGMRTGGYVICITPTEAGIQWANTVANDDWDIYCMGYWTEA